jgi:hypothetical protein
VNSKSEIDRRPLGFSFISKGWRRFGPGVDLAAATVHRKTRRAQARRVMNVRRVPDRSLVPTFHKA